MNILTRLPFVLAATFALAACGTDFPLEVSDQVMAHAELGGAIRATQEANNSGDAEAWVALFDESFRYMPPFMPAVTDRDSLRMLAENGFSDWRTEVMIQPVEMSVTGDWAIVDAEVRGRSVSTTDADTMLVDLKQLIVYRQTERGWLIYRLMSSPNG